MAAKKNAKRVAGGKKAARARARGKGRRRSSGGRGSRRKPIQRGITGKIGAFIMGVAPPVIAGLEAASQAKVGFDRKQLNGFGAVHYGFMRFINNMGNGIIGWEPFHEKMSFSGPDGRTSLISVDSGLPKGSLLGVMVTGAVAMFFDAFASKLAGGRPVKIPGTNYNATGGS